MDGLEEGSSFEVSSRQSQWRTNATRIAMVVIVLAVGVSLLVEIKSGVAETNHLVSSEYVASQNLEDAYFQCLTHQVKSLVPATKRVWVSAHTPGGRMDDITLKKVVLSYATIAYRQAGVVRLTLEKTHGTRTGCLGMIVKAQAPDGTVRFGSGSLVGSIRQLPLDQR
jgi:hypothetical protein